MRCRRRKGFTLAELLVVMAIVSLMAAVLLPVLIRARDAARRASCVANLHQITLAFTAYCQDYDNDFPPCGLSNIQSLADLDTLWFRQIAPYLKSQGVLHCPADNVRNAQRTCCAALPQAWDQPGLPALSYGANWDLMSAAAAGRREANLQALPSPSLTLLAADCTEPWAFGPVYTDAQGVLWSHIAYANGPPVDQASSVFHGGRSGMGHERHGTGSCIAYIDGHVRFLPAARFYREVGMAVDASGRRHAFLVERPILSPAAVPPSENGQQP
jgi:prepilin-type N-terminal cleavage/methylation domain-containing protein/prepilin-type processing-associated H-X9-DG protein